MNLAIPLAIAHMIASLVAPPPQMCLAGELPMASSNLKMWQIWGAPAPQGPYQFVGELVFTNHFEIPMTNGQMFYQFYPEND